MPDARREPEQKEGETVVRNEGCYGQQYRNFTLAHEIDDAQAVAKYQDGVPELSLPGTSGATGKKSSSVGSRSRESCCLQAAFIAT